PGHRALCRRPERSRGRRGRNLLSVAVHGLRLVAVVVPRRPCTYLLAVLEVAFHLLLTVRVPEGEVPLRTIVPEDALLALLAVVVPADPLALRQAVLEVALVGLPSILVPAHPVTVRLVGVVVAQLRGLSGVVPGQPGTLAHPVVVRPFLELASVVPVGGPGPFFVPVLVPPVLLSDPGHRPGVVGPMLHVPAVRFDALAPHLVAVRWPFAGFGSSRRAVVGRQRGRSDEKGSETQQTRGAE